MVGLSVILEEDQSREGSSSVGKKASQVINKVTINIKSPKSSSSSSSSSTTTTCSSTSSCSSSHPTPTTTTSFLDYCFLCRQKLLLGNDIYMYQGDRGFCSVECRSRQIYMDEEEKVKRSICSLAAMRTRSISSSTTSNSHNRQGSRSRANKGFAY
ncbi:hypothetical protein LguiA_031217 [Lonicera macranthoides]